MNGHNDLDFKCLQLIKIMSNDLSTIETRVPISNLKIEKDYPNLK